MSIQELMKNHRSIRKYKNEDVKEEDLKAILESAIHAPSSINGQQWSVIVVKDQKKREKIAELSGGQNWIAQAPVFLLFVGDYHKTAYSLNKAGLPFGNIDSQEATMVMSVDVGIAFSNAMNCAESLNYGIVPIGGIRRSPDEMIDLLELPKYVYPILGMCVGVPDETPMLKPRFPFNSVVHYEKYDSSNTKEKVEEYDRIINDYMNIRTEGSQVKGWSDTVNQVYSIVYFPKVKPSLERQGFKNIK